MAFHTKDSRYFFNFANRGTKYGKRKQQDSPLIFMLVFYLGMAYMFLFSRVLAERMSPTVRYVMGGVFLLYGVYRLYRQVKATDRDNE